jgi:hypothetical protein
MAQFPKVNGDYQPVAVFDDGVGNNAAGTSHAGFNNGLNALSSGFVVQPQGPRLNFFTVTATGNLTGAQVNVLVETIQQLSTIYIYEYTFVNAGNDTFAMAIYDTQSWTAAGIDTALAAAGIAGTTTTATATFSNQ